MKFGRFNRTASDIGETADEIVDRAGEKADELVDGAADLADRAAFKARRAGRHASSELENFFDDVEDLVRHSTDVSDADIANVRARVEGRLHSARDTATRGIDYTVGRSRQAARVTDDYVRGNPWTAIGAVALVGIAVGALMQRR